MNKVICKYFDICTKEKTNECFDNNPLCWKYYEFKTREDNNEVLNYWELNEGFKIANNESFALVSEVLDRYMISIDGNTYEIKENLKKLDYKWDIYRERWFKFVENEEELFAELKRIKPIVDYIIDLEGVISDEGKNP